MSKAYQCDRCGTYGDSPSRRLWGLHGGIGQPPLPHARRNDYYLCESCASDFDDFMALRQ